MTKLVLSFDMRAPEFGGELRQLYAGALEMAEWADGLGFDTVSVMEHHSAEDGYLPSPMILASAVAARTRRCIVRIAALILPLHDPLRVAEDLAVVDIISGGRLLVVIGAGYREKEFEMFGVDLADRPRLIEEGIEVIKQAWTGEPFEYKGRTVQVTPCPLQRPCPAIILGGSFPASARRAARIADGFRPAKPELAEAYEAELVKLGKTATAATEKGGVPFVFVSDDPDRDWARIAPHALHETNSYSSWAPATPVSLFRPATDPDVLRKPGRYLVLTPDECVERARLDGTINLRPLMGGMPPELGWQGLRTFESEVLPRLR